MKGYKKGRLFTDPSVSFSNEVEVEPRAYSPEEWPFMWLRAPPTKRKNHGQLRFVKAGKRFDGHLRFVKRKSAIFTPRPQCHGLITPPHTAQFLEQKISATPSQIAKKYSHNLSFTLHSRVKIVQCSCFM